MLTKLIKLIACNCFNGANCTENGTCICPEGYSGLQCETLTVTNNTNVTSIINTGGGGFSGKKLAIVLAVPIVGGSLLIGSIGTLFSLFLCFVNDN